MRVTLVLAVAIAVSAGANVYLLAADPTPAPRALGPPAKSPPNTVAVTPTNSDVAAVFAPDCPSHVRLLHTRLADAKRRLDERLSLPDRFSRATGSPDSERRLRALLEPKFGKDLRIACRGSVCRIDPPTDFDRFIEDIQTFDERVAFKSLMFSDHVLVELLDDDVAAGLRLQQALARAVYVSPDITACKTQHPTAGYLGLRVELTATGLVFTEEGPLSGSPFSTCARKAMDRIVAGMSIPRDVQVPENWTVEIDVP